MITAVHKTGVLLTLTFLFQIQLTRLAHSEQDSVLSAGPYVLSTSPDVAFTEANRLFDNPNSSEDLRSAAATYLQLIENGHKNGHLYYNAGNSFLRLEDLGHAILNFQRALLYNPDNPYAIAMLREARSQVNFPLKMSAEENLLKTLFFWHFRLPFRSRLSIFSLSFSLFWLLLSLRLYTRIPFNRLAIFCCFLLFSGSAISIAISSFQKSGLDAVVIAKEAEVRSGNGKNFELAIDLPLLSGVEVRILDTRGHWHLVEYAGNTLGWLQANTIEAVEGPPR